MQLLFFVVPLVAEFSLALQAHMTWSVHTLQKVYKLGVFTTTPQLQSLRCSSVYICFTVLLLLFFSSSYFFSACCGSFVPVQSGPDRMCIDKEQKNWVNQLPAIEFAINSARSETTGYAPFFLNYRRMPRTMLFNENSEYPGIKKFTTNKKCNY